jgi:hypothetical protein
VGIEGYLDIIKSALEEVPQEYYKLRTTYSSDGIVRERVFCYELYHRMRCLQERQGKNLLRIHGEIDKRGHELFELLDRRNPDFVFHVPGSMKENTVIIEVKGNIDSGDYLRKVKEDLETLLLFTRIYNYKAGVFIIYNYSQMEFKNKAHKSDQIKAIQVEPQTAKQRVVILCKKSFFAPIEQCALNELLESGDNHEYAGNPGETK